MDKTLTIFTSSKSGEDTPENFRFTNAVSSWNRLKSVRQVYAFTDDGVPFDIPVDRSQSGLPIIPSMFASILNRSQDPILGYVNSDIILISDFDKTLAAARKKFSEFLLVGRRWNWHRPLLIEFAEDWEKRLYREARENGSLFNPASDIFIYTRNVFNPSEIPQMAMSAYYWDPYLMWYAMEKGTPVIDCTYAIFSVHQNHPVASDPRGPEAKRNFDLARESEEAHIDLDKVPFFMTAQRRILKR